MIATMNEYDYKKAFILITLIFTAWFGSSHLAYATDYSLGNLNRTMQKKMDELPKNKEEPYAPYRQGDIDTIREQFNKAKELGNQSEILRAECANNNENACIEIGIDINDPCRPFTNNQDIYACRMQQCNNGNQADCDKINTYNNRIKNIQESLQKAQNNNSQRTRESDCWRSNVNCRSLCRSFNPTDSYCTDKCEVEYKACQ